MRLDAANRSFYTLVGLAAVPYLALATVGCGLISYVIARLAADGGSALTGPGWDLRLALGFLTVLGTSTVASGWSLQRQWRATRGLEAHVRSRSASRGPAVDALAGDVDLPSGVDVVDEDDPFCFTYGIRTPRVAVSTGLLDRVTGDELGAVLTHERYHVRNNDPLKLMVARSLTRAFFFLPALTYLHRRYLAARELAADRRAVRDWGRTPLVGALVKAVSGPGWSEMGAAAAIGGSAHLELRVDQLERGAEPAFPPLPRPVLWATSAGLTALVAMLVAAVSAAGGRDALMERMDSSSTAMSDWPALLAFAVCAVGWVLAAGLVLRWLRTRQRTRTDQTEHVTPSRSLHDNHATPTEDAR